MYKTIGQQLKQAREGKNLTIQKVVQATQIRARYIQAIEVDDFESLPSPVQARAFLRLYAEYLGLSLDDAIAQQRAGVEELRAVSLSLNPPPGQPEVPATDVDIGPRLETETVWGMLRRLLTHIRRVVPRATKQIAPVEPVEARSSVEFVEAENGKIAAPTDEARVSIPETPPSQEFFSTIGKTLLQRRESLSLTLDEIERHTHVRKHYLQALEAGEFGILPSSVQARGMLNNYARFLNLDVDALLLTFAEGLQTQLLERQAQLDEAEKKSASQYPYKNSLPLKIKIPATIRRYLSVDIFVGGGLVVILISFAIWGTSRVINMRTESTPQPTAPSILNIIVSPPEQVSPTSTPTAAGIGSGTDFPVAGETLVLTIPAVGQGAVQVVVIAQEAAWVRVTVDGKVQFEGRVIAGTAYPFDGNIQIEVLTGNGRAISILYNQNNLGPMGDLGQVVDRIYTANAILNPTATFTPTPTISPTPTITLRPTPTLPPSLTPRPSATPRISPTPKD